MEVGKIELVNVIDPAHGGVFESISFQQIYTNPVVIAYVMTYAGGEPIDVRVRNITSIGCDIFMQEYDNDGHAAEWISYAVIESGSYTLANGVKMEAGSVAIPSNAAHTAPAGPGTFDTVTIPFEHTFVGTPSFFVTLNTYNNNDFMSVSSLGVTTTEAQVFQERQRAPQVPANEVAGWLAIETSIGTFPSGVLYETAHFQDGSSDGVGETPRHQVTYTHDQNEPPIVFSQINTLNGSDGSWARGYFWGTDYFETYAEEVDDGGDRGHNDEVFSHLIFDEAFAAVYDEELGDLEVTINRNLWAADPYVFKATAAGVNVFDLETESLLSYAVFPGGATSVWSNDDHLYMATSVSGVYRAPLSTVTGTITLTPYKSYPDITANDVNYIHGAGDYLCVATASGVDRIKISTDDREYHTTTDVSKCFQNSNGDYYYIINPYDNITGLDDNVFGWNYGRVIELSRPISEDNYQLKLELPLTQPDDIFAQAAQNGVDIRFIDNFGRTVPHFIETWNYADPPTVWVRLNQGVESLRFIYGNRTVLDASSAEDTFTFFDHFEGTTLDTNKWSFDNAGYGAHYYTVANSIIKFRTTSNSYAINFTCMHATLGGVAEASVKQTTTQYATDMDYNFQFQNGVNGAIGVATTDTHERPHRLTSRTEQPYVDGTKYLKNTFNVHALTEWADYQASEYDGELLTSSGTLTNGVGYRTIKFSYHSASNQPDLSIDWVRIRTYDPDPPTIDVGRGNSINALFEGTELHAIYEAGGGYTYAAAQYNVISSAHISDIHVTGGTSSYNYGNTIFLGTSWGASVIEERRGDEDNCRKRIYLIES